MISDKNYDLIVLGGGPGGYVSAIQAAKNGLKVACVDKREELGGTCLNVGCIPSKALLESSLFYHQIQKKTASHGIEVPQIDLNLHVLLERKNRIVKSLTQGLRSLLQKNKIDFIHGKASFLSSRKIQIETSDKEAFSHTADSIIIATGSEPTPIKSVPFDGKRIVSSQEALDFQEIPQHLIVVGGGVIGLELGSVWSRLGAKVSVLEAQESLVPMMDRKLGASLYQSLKKQGMDFYLNTYLKTVETKENSITIKAEREGKEILLEGDKLLICIGRRPYTEGLQLEKAGVDCNARGFIVVDERFQTTQKHVFAIGDVIGEMMLAHKSEEEGIAVANLLVNKSGYVNYNAIPSVIYTHPEIASVGLSEEQCKKKNIDYKIGQCPFLINGRAKCHHDSEGWVKILADQKTDRILGIHIIGTNASELIAEATIAMEYKASAEDIGCSVHAHPTLAEAIKEAALKVNQQSIHI